MANSPVDYPVNFSIDYPDRALNRLTTFFRIFTIIPIGIILALVVESSGTAIVILPLILMLLFRKKYPRWWFDWNIALTRFSLRVTAYFSLLDDVYPSTDEEQSVHLDIPYPDAANELSRGMPLVKWFLAIPHFIVLYFLAIGAAVCIIIAWFAILFTGHYPKALFNFVVGVLRWGLRVCAYALLLTTDKYPPFSLD
jgi:hypothetical protein